MGSSPHLIGLVYQDSSKSVLIADLGKGVVWKVDPKNRKSSVFMQAPTIIAGKSPGLNALIQGLLFPASLAFSPDKSRLYITNLALYLPFAGVPSIAVDAGWTLRVKHYNIAAIDIP